MDKSVKKNLFRKTIPDIISFKGNKEPLVCITAYSAPMAKVVDKHVDLILVGDSLGMVMYGMDSTLPVTLEMMINHGLAVMRGSNKSCVIVDLPFGSYQASPQDAFLNAVEVIAKTGCGGVKLEGGCVMADTIEYLVKRGIPVMGHIGMMPQSFNLNGGYGVKGNLTKETSEILADAIAVQEAGAFAVVIESTTEELARKITDKLTIPTIGIGASPACDGQIIVAEDILGIIDDFKPKFVKRFANLNEEISNAVKCYSEEVRARIFPSLEHCYKEKREVD